jgi:3-hydroxyacyl-CoA dehydrogenase
MICGITIDPKLDKIYWTQKGPTKGGLGRIFRANIEIPKGETPTSRSDIEVLFDRLPEPIGLELDLANRVLYWTDRGDPPRGNSVNRVPIDTKAVQEIMVTHLMEGIGIALDVPGNRMFVTDFAGSVYSADLDGKNDRRVAIVGTGVIGASWAALFLAKGLDVVATDPAPNAEPRLREFVANAWPALTRLGLSPGASQSRLKFTSDLAEALANADLVQENGPERIDFKQKLYGQLDELLPSDAIIASSSSGLTMSEIQKGAATHPERCVIGHPFNPPHLIPLVEIVGGAKTSEKTIRRASEFYTSIGQRTVRLNKEMPGHVANRLQAALAREVYYLVAEGIVSAADVDTALSWGPGLRWGIMGNLMLNHLGGGPGGIEHFFHQFSGPMTAWWKTLGSPVLTPDVQQKLIDSVHAEVGSRTIAELEAERDEVLLGLLELRKKAAKSAQTKSIEPVA